MGQAGGRLRPRRGTGPPPGLHGLLAARDGAAAGDQPGTTVSSWSMACTGASGPLIRGAIAR